MNGRKAKAIRRQAKEDMVEWLQSLLEGEEKDKVTLSSVLDLAPKQTHVLTFGTIKLSIYSFKWFVKMVKQGKDWRAIGV
jgi:hypothetical protein